MKFCLKMFFKKSKKIQRILKHEWGSDGRKSFEVHNIFDQW